MPKSLDVHVQETLGALTLQVLQLTAQLEATSERLAAALAPKPDAPVDPSIPV